jgi:6-phosphofructokinase 1
VFNSIYASRSAPANSIDTKLCWYDFINVSQIAQGSVMGVMAGYTNFAVGHLANKSTMISIDELIHS